MPLAAAGGGAEALVVSFAVRGLAAAASPVAVFVKGSVSNLIFRVPLSGGEKGVGFCVELHVVVFGGEAGEEESVARAILALSEIVVGFAAARALAQCAGARDERADNEGCVGRQIVERVRLVELVAFGWVGGEALEPAHRVDAIVDHVVEVDFQKIFVWKVSRAGADKERQSSWTAFQKVSRIEAPETGAFVKQHGGKADVRVGASVKAFAGDREVVEQALQGASRLHFKGGGGVALVDERSQTFDRLIEDDEEWFFHGWRRVTARYSSNLQSVAE